MHSAHSITCLFDAALKLSGVLHYSGLKVHWMTMNFYGSWGSEPDRIELQSCRCCFGLTKRGACTNLLQLPSVLKGLTAISEVITCMTNNYELYMMNNTCTLTWFWKPNRLYRVPCCYWKLHWKFKTCSHQWSELYWQWGECVGVSSQWDWGIFMQPLSRCLCDMPRYQ